MWCTSASRGCSARPTTDYRLLAADYRLRLAVQPDVDARRVPVVRLLQDVETAVAIEVGEACLVKAHAVCELHGLEMSSAIAVEDPGASVRVVGHRRRFLPLGHFPREDVDVPVTVHVAESKAVTVDDVALDEIVAVPRRRIVRTSLAGIPPQRTDAIARCDDDLRRAAFNQLSRGDASANRRNPDCTERR